MAIYMELGVGLFFVFFFFFGSLFAKYEIYHLIFFFKSIDE